jgi:hypothetical protein
VLAAFGLEVTALRPVPMPGQRRFDGWLQGEGLMIIAQFGTGQVVWSMFWFSLFFLYVYLAIVIILDVLHSEELGGPAKAGWTLFVIVLPFMGVFTYLVVRGSQMGGRFGPVHTREQIDRSRRSAPPAPPSDVTRP